MENGKKKFILFEGHTCRRYAFHRIFVFDFCYGAVLLAGCELYMYLDNSCFCLKVEALFGINLNWGKISRKTEDFCLYISPTFKTRL
jgi:hypothetical protein